MLHFFSFSLNGGFEHRLTDRRRRRRRRTFSHTRKKVGRLGERKSRCTKKWGKWVWCRMPPSQMPSCLIHKERKLHLQGIPSLQRANKRSLKDMLGNGHVLWTKTTASGESSKFCQRNIVNSHNSHGMWSEVFNMLYFAQLFGGFKVTRRIS